MMQIIVKTYDGEKQIEIDERCVYGDFAAHLALVGDSGEVSYSVTHIPSGLMCQPFRYGDDWYSWEHIEGAEAFARELARVVSSRDIFQDENGIWQVAASMKPKWRKIMQKMGFNV